MKKRIILIQIGLFLWCLNCTAAVNSLTEKLVLKSIDVLSKENLIVGKYKPGSFSTARPTEQAWAFSVIMMKSEQPVADMVKLARTGSYYGLIGLFKLDKSKYHEELKQFKCSNTVIVLYRDAIEEFEPEEFLTSFIDREGEKLVESLLFDELPDWVETIRIKWPYRAAFQSEPSKPTIEGKPKGSG